MPHAFYFPRSAPGHLAIQMMTRVKVCAHAVDLSIDQRLEWRQQRVEVARRLDGIERVRHGLDGGQRARHIGMAHTVARRQAWRQHDAGQRGKRRVDVQQLARMPPKCRRARSAGWACPRPGHNPASVRRPPLPEIAGAARTPAPPNPPRKNIHRRHGARPRFPALPGAPCSVRGALRWDAAGPPRWCGRTTTGSGRKGNATADAGSAYRGIETWPTLYRKRTAQKK